MIPIDTFTSFPKSTEGDWQTELLSRLSAYECKYCSAHTRRPIRWGPVSHSQQANLLSLTTCRLQNQIELHSSAHNLHHLRGHLCAISSSLGAKLESHARAWSIALDVGQHQAAHWAQALSVVHVLGTSLELARSHRMTPCQLCIATNAWRTDEQPLKHATLRMLFTF